MKKVWLVARREYLSTVRRKGFIITTIGMPLFFAMIFAIMALVAAFSIRAAKPSTDSIGIVDESGLLNFDLLEKVADRSRSASVPPELENIPPLLRESTTREMRQITEAPGFRSFATRASAKEAFLRKEIRGYYVIPARFLEEGEIRLEIRRGGFMSNSRPGWSLLQRFTQASLLEGKVDRSVAERVWQPPRLRSSVLTESGEPDKAGGFSEASSFLVPYFFTLLFMISIMSSAGYLLQGVVEEKENRVIEILLSSLTPDQLLAGKVVGLCAAGLTQIAAWVVIGVTPALFLFPFLELRWSQLVVALVFFLLGFLMFGALIGGTGSLGSNIKESQQLSLVWTMISVVPLFFIAPLLAQPSGALARALSYIPLTAPVTMMLRVSATSVPWWDIMLSALIILAGLFLFLRLGARLFRLGILMYGKRPSVVEIVRWLRST